jgi:hypothetical protein
MLEQHEQHLHRLFLHLYAHALPEQFIRVPVSLENAESRDPRPGGITD